MVEKSPTQKENEVKIAILLEDLNFLEAYVNDIFDFSPTPLAFISILGVILEINPAFKKISGFTSEEIIGKGVEEVVEKDKIKKIAEETLRKDSVEGREVRLMPKSKKEIPVHVFTRVRRDHHGEKLGYFLSLFDLTNIRKTEAKGRADLLKVLEDVKQARDDAGEEKTKHWQLSIILLMVF